MSLIFYDSFEYIDNITTEWGKVKMDSVNIKIFNNPEEAPNYNEMSEKFDSLILEEIVVVREGTVQGKPTVDFVFRDKEGRKHISLVKASYIEIISRIAGGIF